ncbi:MAG: S8 family serine peptidase [Candidatus Kariarchaeaceae archaeon]
MRTRKYTKVFINRTLYFSLVSSLLIMTVFSGVRGNSFDIPILASDEKYSNSDQSSASSIHQNELLSTPSLPSLDLRLQSWLEEDVEPLNLINSSFGYSLIILSESLYSSSSFELVTSLKMGDNYLQFGFAPSKSAISKLSTDPSIKWLGGDYRIDTPSTDPSLISSDLNHFEIRDITGVLASEQEFGVTGEGIVVAVSDSGTDFGVTDLSSSFARNEAGFPLSFDPSGTGLGLTPLSLSPVKGDLTLTSIDFPVWFGESQSLINYSDFDLPMEDFHVGTIFSQSNTFKFGFMMEFTSGLIQLFPTILVDSQVSGFYDKLYIDFDTGFALTLVFNGIIDRNDAYFYNLADWDFTDESAHFLNGSEILAKDITDDGLADLSAGALANTLDLYGIIEQGKIFTGIDSNGEGFAVMYDTIGHGTSTAGDVAGRGITSFNVFDDLSTQEMENTTSYLIPGMASGASIMAVKGLGISDYLQGWLWTAGFELLNNGSWIIPDNCIPRAQISSNSWGISDYFELGSGYGYDLLSQFVDYLSVPGSVSPDYPGILFVISAGNGGPGYGSLTTPGTAAAALTVGSSTSYHFYDNVVGSDNGYDQVSFFSNRGPTSLGLAKPDVVNVGEGGFSVKPLALTLGNGSLSWTLFSGTSQSCPLTSGIAALVYDALDQPVNEINPLLVKNWIKGGAVDLSFDIYSQGAGRVDAYRAIKFALEDYSLGTNPLIISSTNSSYTTIGSKLDSASDFWFGIPSPLSGLDLPDGSFYGGVLRADSQVSNQIEIDTDLDLASLVIEPLTWTLDNEMVSQGTTTDYRSIIDLSYLFTDVSFTTEFLQLMITYDRVDFDKIQTFSSIAPIALLFDWEDQDGDGDITFPATSSAPSEVKLTSMVQSVSNSLVLQISNPYLLEQPYLFLYDPGFEDSPIAWNGFNYTISVRTFTTQSMETVSVVKFGSGNIFDLNINIPSNALPGNYQGKIVISYLTHSFILPITYTVLAEVEHGPSETMIDQSVDGPFDNSAIYGMANEDWRPDTGDWRFFHLEVTDPSAKTLVLSLEWQFEETVIDFILHDSKGEILQTSDIIYLAAGLFDSNPSLPTEQNYLVDISSHPVDNYTLILHVTKFAAEQPYESFSLSASFALILPEEITAPEVNWDPDNAFPLSNNLTATWSDLVVPEIPKMEIIKTRIDFILGEITIIEDELIDPTLGFFTVDKWIALNLTEGATTFTLSWEDTIQDFDFYLFEVNNSSQYDDLLNFQMISLNNPEEGVVIIPRNGTYYLAVDLADGSLDGDLAFELTIDTTQKTSFIVFGNEISVDSNILEDNIYQVKLTAYTNFNYELSTITSFTVKNAIFPQINWLSPANSSSLSGEINLSWEVLSGSETLFFNLFYSNSSEAEIKYSLASGISTTSYLWDTSSVYDGTYDLLLIASDGTNTVSVSVLGLVIDNDNTSPPPFTTPTPTPDSNGGFLAFDFLTIFIALSTISVISLHNKKRKN